MEYPHEKYICFLLSKKYTNQEVQEDCLRLSLLVPLEIDLDLLRSKIGTPPSTWTPTYEKGNGYFNKWLRKRNLLDLWINNNIINKTINFLYKKAIRTDFETLVIAHSSVREARIQLLLKYPENAVPDEDVLEKYYEIFWDVESLSKDGLIEFLGRYSDKETKLAALDGNLVETYARAGLNEKISTNQFLNNVIALANHQVQLARMSGEILSGNSMMGIAAIARQGLEAIKHREEIEASKTIDVLDNIREQANAFQVRKINTIEMITIDDLEDENDRPRLSIIND